MRIRNLEGRVFLVIVLLTTAIFLWMVRAFLMPVFWAAVFAILFRPVHLRLAELLRGRTVIAALLTTLLVVFAVLIPVGLIIASVAQQALALYQQIASGAIDLSAPVVWVEQYLPRLMGVLAEYGIGTAQVYGAVQSTAIAVTQWFAGQALTIGQNIVMVTLMFVLMLYFLFFFFRDGDRLVQAAIRALPMGDERERQLFRKFAEASRATVKGTLVIAVIQGTIGGILFAVVDIQAALFWGVVMGILSLLPAVGPALVWGPAAIIQFVTGGIWQGILLVVAGTIVIGLVDNVLRPILVGREIRMPDYLILLTTLGGISAFGLAGFVLGPIIAALTLVLWEMFSDEYAPLDSSEPPAVPTAVPDAAVPAAPPPDEADEIRPDG
jgi:predicted PurR-regulated permease PerM